MIYKTIGVPLGYGCNIEGAELGIKNLDIPFDTVIDCPALLGQTEKLQNLESVLTACKNLADASAGEHYPIAIGGDHSLAMGSLMASKAPGIIWIDTHGDINTHESSVSHRIHGMPLAAAMGYGADELTSQFSFHRSPENVTLFGTRDLDSPEQKFVEAWGMNHWSMKDIRTRGFDACFAELMELYKDTPFHLSFDLDCLNPDEYPFVNLPYSDGEGFTKEEGAKMIHTLTALPHNTGLDIVEYNPLKDDNGDGKSYMRRLWEIAARNREALKE